ncbi:hypothetical protein [Amycolatopsis sp.]|uniref:hypothetical protein n=1 Tax=Amycolatopsis sp. TaxID=37632 RepID=UPI002D7ECB47|nr:hypothetical protein [Amycolatopsis sp.]HET6708649.1 hypothetical protein [Amycolatopsis sp.]
MDENYARRLRNWLRAEPGGTAEEREWLRGIPEPASHEPDTPDRWTVRGQLPAEPDDDWVCPVIALPVPRPSRENGCRVSAIELSRQEASPMTDAEARSRWNHPTNWHRRRAAEEQRRRDEPGSR